MYYPSLLNENEKKIQQEVRKFVREEVSPDFIRALDRDGIEYPREYEVLAGSKDARNVELDARGQDAEAEKRYTDEDMWRVHAG